MAKARRGVKRCATRIMAAYSGAAEAAPAGDGGQDVDFTLLTYKELQERASAAGMRSVGVSRENLIIGLQGNEQ